MRALVTGAAGFVGGHLRAEVLRSAKVFHSRWGKARVHAATQGSGRVGVYHGKAAHSCACPGFDGRPPA